MADDVRARMRGDLTTAMKARDTTTVSVLRTALAAVDNAEATPEIEPNAAHDEYVVGSTVGVGSADVARLTLSENDIRAVLRREADDRLDAAGTYEDAGQPDHARRLRAEADILATYTCD